MCSGSEAGSYIKAHGFVHHSTLALIVIEKKKRCYRGLAAQRRRGKIRKRLDSGKRKKLSNPGHETGFDNSKAERQRERRIQLDVTLEHTITMGVQDGL